MEIGSLIILVVLVLFWCYYHQRLVKAKKEHKRLVKKVRNAKNNSKSRKS